MTRSFKVTTPHNAEAPNSIDGWTKNDRPNVTAWKCRTWKWRTTEI